MKRKILRLVLAASTLLGALFLAGSPAAGQSRGGATPQATFELAWWSASGGGGSYSSGGGYTLGGTVGQPAAAGERSGGGYTLLGGFWQPSCVAAAVAATIARAGTAVTLSWTHNAANQGYQVHRSEAPYFTPSDATRQAWVTGPPWSYADAGAAGDPSHNYFYVVRATCGAAYADPGRQGEFGFRLAPGH